MSHFYGTLQGNRGQATRCGTKSSGVTAVAASWRGCIKVWIYRGDDDRDHFQVTQNCWQGSGVYEVLAEGIIGEPVRKAARNE
jgi:hypothetical protein